MGPPPAAPGLVDGERLPYLGRSYGLRLVDAPAAPFALRRGRFELDRGLDGDARAAVVRWYTARGQTHLEARVAHFAPLTGATPIGRGGARPRRCGAGASATPHARRSASTGSSCCRRPRPSTTWSCTSSRTCTSRTTSRRSGGASRRCCRTGRHGGRCSRAPAAGSSRRHAGRSAGRGRLKPATGHLEAGRTRRLRRRPSAQPAASASSRRRHQRPRRPTSRRRAAAPRCRRGSRTRSRPDRRRRSRCAGTGQRTISHEPRGRVRKQPAHHQARASRGEVPHAQVDAGELPVRRQGTPNRSMRRRPRARRTPGRRRRRRTPPTPGRRPPPGGTWRARPRGSAGTDGLVPASGCVRGRPYLRFPRPRGCGILCLPRGRGLGCARRARGRLAQRESARLTRGRSLVQIQHRPPRSLAHIPPRLPLDALCGAATSGARPRRTLVPHRVPHRGRRGACRAPDGRVATTSASRTALDACATVDAAASSTCDESPARACFPARL